MARMIQPVHEDTFTAMLEQLQEGYVYAVAASAGCSVNVQRRDTFGVDALITRHREGDEFETHLFAQLKCTTTVRAGEDAGDFVFSFKHQRQIERLQQTNPSGLPTILIVMVAHPSQANWATGDHDSLTIRHSCYWKHVAGADPGETDSDLSVRMHRTQLFDAAALLGIMDRIQEGGTP